MRCLNRNKVPFWYALYKDKKPIPDEYGNLTGEYDIIRHNPIKSKANISASAGEAVVQPFGKDISYDKVIVMSDPATPIDEYTALWIDSAPQLNEDGSLAVSDNGEVLTPHDYVVKKVADGLNSVLIAVSKVDVRG